MRTYKELVKAEYDFQVRNHWIKLSEVLECLLEGLGEFIEGFCQASKSIFLLLIGILVVLVIPFVYLYRFCLKPLILPLYKREQMEKVLDEREERRKKKLDEYFARMKK